MNRYLRLIAAVLLVGCANEADNPAVQEQEVVREGASIAPNADLSVVPASSIFFTVEVTDQVVWREHATPLFAGGTLTLLAVAERFPTCGIDGTVTASMKLTDGQIVDVVLGESQGSAKTGTVTLPATKSLEIWLKSENNGCVEYDSRFGENYKFDVAEWRPVAVHFRGDFTQSADAALTQGGALLVDYDIQRLPNCRVNYRGFPNWFIKAWVRYSTGEMYWKSIVKFDYSNTGTPLESYTVHRAAFPIPQGATWAQLWFENDQYPPTCHEWDSNNSQNYEFPVVPPAVDQCQNSERWEGPTMAFSYCPDYAPAVHYNANSCEFYVDGFGSGSFSHNGASASYLEAWLKVRPQDGTVVGAGMWSRLVNTNGVVTERMSFGTETQPGTWKTGTTTARSIMGSGSFNLTAQAASFFIDVRRNDGAVHRVWLSRGGQNFDVAQTFSVPGYVENRGVGSIQWAHDSAAVFDQKRVCQ